MSKKKKPTLLVWRDAFLSRHGPEPNARLALMGLLKRGKPDGSGMYPGVRTVAEDTGLSERTATKYLRIAAGYGLTHDGKHWVQGPMGRDMIVGPVWIERHKRKRGEHWKSFAYLPAIPLAV